jgi:hypothetical protein
MIARIAADIPGSLMSSSGCGVVTAGGVFVVAGLGLGAAVEDADEVVGELAVCGLVADVLVAELLVIGPVLGVICAVSGTPIAAVRPWGVGCGCSGRARSFWCPTRG